MARKFDFDLDADDDFDDIFDKKSSSSIENVVVKNEEDYYQEFIQEDSGYSIVDNDYGDDEYEDDNEDLENSFEPSQSLIDYLSLFYTWFTRIGVGIMIILMAVFITNGDFLSLFKYILLLVGAFFFGYFFMFFLDRFKENN